MLVYASTEDESVAILRETAANFRLPVLLFSGGKDSITLLHLARLAFYPAPLPFRLLHVDTGHNFPEVIAFRDKIVAEWGLTLWVAKVEDTLRTYNIVEPAETIGYSRNRLQALTLTDAIQHYGIDACIGGARRDEEKARAKERIFSLRNETGKWDIRHQRPELFYHLNAYLDSQQHIRVFPLSNWTEAEIWRYILAHQIEVPSLYYAHKRQVFLREGTIWADAPFVHKQTHEIPFEASVRFRTVGDMTCTAGIFSSATTIPAILQENQASHLSERGSRIDDKFSEGAMEIRKMEGYF